MGRGLVANLARPGGNATGISFLSVELDRKRLELLREVMPNAAVIAVLLNAKNPQAETQTGEVRQAALVLGLQINFLNASTEAVHSSGASRRGSRNAGPN